MSNSKHSQPKLNRVPSRRDQEIFRRVVVQCELQYQVAKDLGLSPGRISQILARVRRWLACGATRPGAAQAPRGTWSSNGKHGSAASDAALDATFSALEQQRLQRQLAQSRHEYLYEISLRGIKHMSDNPKHTTIRTEVRMDAGDSEIQNPKTNIQNSDAGNIVTRRIVTVRDQPLNVQLIKTAQRSAIELQKLAELDPLPPPEIAVREDRRAIAADLVTELLDDAVAADKVRSVGWDTEREFVDDLLKFLLGEPHRGLATNIIAADAHHGRLRSDDRPYPGHDPMPAAQNSPLARTKPGPGSPTDDVGCVESSPDDETHHSLDSALNNTKPQHQSAKQIVAQQPTSSPSITSGAINDSADPPGPLTCRAPSDFPLQNPQRFSPPSRPKQDVRLTCPIVVNPP